MMEQKILKAMVLFGVSVGAVAAGVTWSGYVLSILWGWFVLPIFTGAPSLSVAPAIGLTIVVGCLTHLTHQRRDKENPNFKDEVLHLALAPAIALSIGWIVKRWMP
jgi:hypothetical protein